MAFDKRVVFSFKDCFGNQKYLSVKDGCVDYGNESLSNMFQPADLFKWACRDAKNEATVIKAFNTYAKYATDVKVLDNY